MLTIFNTHHVWVPEMLAAAKKRGVQFRLVMRPEDVTAGYLYFVPRQFPPMIDGDLRQGRQLFGRADVRFIQDREQIALYENKVAQSVCFKDWMPQTWMHAVEEAARFQARCTDYPVISKASVGSASHNVRLLKNIYEAEAEIDAVFGDGLPIRQGPGEDSLQKGYVLWQEFIPHDVTYRVTIVGTALHVYRRFNYPDRPMAAPSVVRQTEPVDMSDEIESLLQFSRRFFEAAGTKWCAIDVLKRGAEWLLLETSLAWARAEDPAGLSPFFGRKHSLCTQHELLLDELEAGVWT